MIIKKFESFNPIKDCEEITFAKKMQLENNIVRWSVNELERVKKIFKIESFIRPQNEEDDIKVSNSEYTLTIKIMYDYQFCIRCSITKVEDEYFTISHMEENSIESGKIKSYYRCDQIYGIKSYIKFFKERFQHLKSLDYSSVEVRSEPRYKIVQN